MQSASRSDMAATRKAPESCGAWLAWRRTQGWPLRSRGCRGGERRIRPTEDVVASSPRLHPLHRRVPLVLPSLRHDPLDAGQLFGISEWFDFLRPPIAPLSTAPRMLPYPQAVRALEAASAVRQRAG